MVNLGRAKFGVLESKNFRCYQFYKKRKRKRTFLTISFLINEKWSEKIAYNLMVKNARVSWSATRFSQFVKYCFFFLGTVHVIRTFIRKSCIHWIGRRFHSDRLVSPYIDPMCTQSSFVQLMEFLQQHALDQPKPPHYSTRSWFQADR